MTQGYYRFPTIHDGSVVFVCEDDLWTVEAVGGVARRLTANPGEALRPALSPDGELLAFTGRDEGVPEIYVMPAIGGPSRRLTFLGAVRTQVVGWSPDGAEIIFSSEAGQPFAGMPRLLAVPHLGGEPRLLPTGPALSISYGPHGGAVIARNVTDLARWKRYRGGLTGDLWVDPDGGGGWRRLITLSGNLAAPIWIGERIFFVSDHEGVGNIYSCLADGEDLRRHTDHADFYVRHPSSDGRLIVYHAGADLWLLDPASGQRRMISVELHSPQPQRKRRFVSPEPFLDAYAIHPAGGSLALTVRGRAFTMGNWDGAVVQYGDEAGRTRLASYLHDGKRLLLLSDAGGEESLEIHSADSSAPPRRLDGLDIGRPLRLLPSPRADLAAITNQRHELLLADLETATLRTLDHSPHGRISGAAWSPDGRWLAYSYPDTRRTRVIRLCEVASGATHTVTRTLLYDTAPAWDPEGSYLYFIGYRDFDPVRDQAQFAWGFPRMARPFLITLRADLPSP
ncbi:MAG: peptidase, partial [Oscillochloris sp.]|nr:peptidase [Oscillochloris sp.]